MADQVVGIVAMANECLRRSGVANNLFHGETDVPRYRKGGRQSADKCFLFGLPCHIFARLLPEQYENNETEWRLYSLTSTALSNTS
jgi:hypothetical protein